MTRDETKELLMMIQAVYPNFKVSPDQMTPTINSWHLMLEEYPAAAVKGAFKTYVKTNSSGFAPAVAQIIGAMYAVKTNDRLNEAEAWALVKRAIQDGCYHAQERFDELPENVQKAVGSANMIKQWAMAESDDVNTVVMSNFQRAYRTVISRKEFSERVPIGIVDSIKGIEANV